MWIRNTESIIISNRVLVSKCLITSINSKEHAENESEISSEKYKWVAFGPWLLVF